MISLEFPEPDAQPQPPVSPIEDQPNPVFRDAYRAFRASAAPRFILHLFLPYPENEYQVLVDAEPVLRADDAEAIVGSLVVFGADDPSPVSAITFGYGMDATCIVAAHGDGTVTVDYRVEDTVPALSDSDNVIEPEHWSNPALLADALDMVGWGPNPALRGQSETPVRYQIACAPLNA